MRRERRRRRCGPSPSPLSCPCRAHGNDAQLPVPEPQGHESASEESDSTLSLGSDDSHQNNLDQHQHEIDTSTRGQEDWDNLLFNLITAFRSRRDGPTRRAPTQQEREEAQRSFEKDSGRLRLAIFDQKQQRELLAQDRIRHLAEPNHARAREIDAERQRQAEVHRARVRATMERIREHNEEHRARVRSMAAALRQQGQESRGDHVIIYVEEKAPKSWEWRNVRETRRPEHYRRTEGQRNGTGSSQQLRGPNYTPYLQTRNISEDTRTFQESNGYIEREERHAVRHARPPRVNIPEIYRELLNGELDGLISACQAEAERSTPGRARLVEARLNEVELFQAAANKELDEMNRVCQKKIAGHPAVRETQTRELGELEARLAKLKAESEEMMMAWK
jgi:hypothetical protein